MYQKYHTEALVLRSREQGEHDRVYTLFTREFGLVRARASAVRTEKSRMRYALQDYAHARVGLVRGKRGWRITGAISGMHHASGGVIVFARISELAMRLVHGEEKNEYLFTTLTEARQALADARREAYATIEIVCVARMLYTLGYLSAEALETALFSHTTYGGDSLVEAETMKDELLSSINKAIAETHL